MYTLLGSSLLSRLFGIVDCRLVFFFALCLEATYEWVHMIFVFLGWVTSLNVFSSRSTENFKMSFFLLCSTPLCKCITFFFIQSSDERDLGCFHVLSITNNAAINIVEHMSLWYDWTSFGYILNSTIAGTWGRLFPNFLRNHHIDFQRRCTSLHSH